MENNEMDFEDFIQRDRDNKISISNIDFLNSTIKENEFLRSIKFFQLLNNGLNLENEKDIRLRKKTQKLNSLLINSLDKLDNLINFLRSIIFEKNIFKLTPLSSESVLDKNELRKINYLKKIDSFKKSVLNFKNKLNKMNEDNNFSQVIFNELSILNEIGLYIDESYSLDMRSVKIKLVHKIFKNYENIVDVTKYNFLLLYNDKKFELMNSYYDNFINKYQLNFIIELNIYGIRNSINLNHVLDKLISEKLIENDKYKINTHIVFYMKYLLYIIFKKEIRALINFNIIYHKNFLIRTEEFGKEYILSVSYYDDFEISIKISKEKKREEVEIINTDIESLYYLNILLNNLIYDSKLYIVLRDFYRNLQSQNLIDLLDNSIFTKNIIKVSNFILRENIIKRILERFDGNVSNFSVSISQYYHTYKFHVFKNNINTKKFDFLFVFNLKNNVFTFENKNFINNNIQIFEKETINKENTFERIDYDYILNSLDYILNFN